jgi:methionyl-tRNA formyltransferase
MTTRSSLRIIFAGTPDFAARHLSYLLASGEHNIIAVYTQPDRPAGRGRQLSASPVKQVALDHELTVFQPGSLKTEEAQAELAALNADLMIVVAYGLLLPQAVLDTPRLGCINVHASLLPRWRGAAPIQRAIEAGDPRTGVTIMQMDIGLDTGDMLRKASCDINSDETSGSLHDKLAGLGCPALVETVSLLASGSAEPEQQNDADSCYASKINKAEQIINWAEPATTLARKIRAFNPFPIAYTTLGKDRIKIWQAQPSPEAQGPAGTIIRSDKHGIVVGCGEGGLRITHLQLPGGKALDVAAIMNSRADWFAVGVQFGTDPK